ncbi:MAG: LysR family transcriptional regulator [Emergencia sp.]|nr:LysR family transcriptional regulator [Emergencia sp.]
MIDFRIYTFIEVCKHMNFTRAAESLALSQPTVSQHIHWVENLYGVKLFVYEGKKMFLTEAGREILSVATTMVHDQEFLQKKVQATKGKRELRLGATLTIGETLIANHVNAHLKKYPEDRIVVEVANTRRLTSLLDLGKIDFALVEGYFEKKEYDYAVYSQENYVCVCGPKLANQIFSETRGKDILLKDLFKERLLLREEGSGTREILEKNLEEQNFSIEDFSNRVEISNIHAIKHLAELNCGITFLYERAVKHELEEGTLVRLKPADFKVYHDFTFIWRKGSVFWEEYEEFFHIPELQCKLYG